jgi:hypothetical protein
MVFECCSSCHENVKNYELLPQQCDAYSVNNVLTHFSARSANYRVSFSNVGRKTSEFLTFKASKSDMAEIHRFCGKQCKVAVNV